MTVLPERLTYMGPEADAGGDQVSPETLENLSHPETYGTEPLAEADEAVIEAAIEIEGIDPDNYQLTPRDRVGMMAQSKLIRQAQGGDTAALEKLWLDSQPLAEAAARAKGPSVLPAEDMVQIALEVVPGAVGRYDSARGASLETFLFRRMIGALIDAERKQSSISRRDYEKLRDALESDEPDARLHALTQPQESDNGRITPGLTMAATLVVDGAVSDVPKSLDAPVHVAGSGGTDEVDGGTQIASGSDVHEEVVRAMDDERLQEAIQALPERERITILNYDPGPGLNLREIGEKLLGGVSESRVSQIHSSAVKRLGRILRSEETPEPEPEPQDTIRITKIKDDEGTLSESEIKANVSAQLAGLDETITLSEEEVLTVLSYIPAWRWRTVESDGETYQMLLRDLEKFAGIKLDLDGQSSERRAVGLKEESVSMLVKEFRASDLLIALDIEKQLASRAEQKVSTSYDFSLLTERQLEIISQLYRTRDEIADHFQLSETAVRGLISRARETLGAESVEDMALAAALKGIILLRKIPLIQAPGLTPRQLQVLRDCYGMNPKDAAAEIGVAKPGVVSGYRYALNYKLGAKNGVQAALIGLRNGLIDYVPR